jgi:hypothetical protein
MVRSPEVSPKRQRGRWRKKSSNKNRLPKSAGQALVDRSRWFRERGHQSHFMNTDSGMLTLNCKLM